MTKSSKAVARLNQPRELAAFLVSPKEYISKHGVDTDDKESTRAFEQYARTLIENVNAANRSVGIAPMEAADWGIGAGCCNSDAMFR